MKARNAFVTLSTVCFVLWIGGCSKAPSTPTGFAVGIGASSEAIIDSEEYQPNPVEYGPEKSTAAPDVHGTFSVENFQGTQANLTYTHESANGFREYLNNWYAHNFIYRDSGVGRWAYYDQAGGDNWDLWTYGGIDRGIDGVLAVFNSSHGGMSAAGRYQFCLGADWAGRGWNAFSDGMTLGANAGSVGDETMRYIFWDTCQSVKWNGVSPWTTWGPRAKGVRMIFGYDTNSVDSPNYGKYFWEEWNKGKSMTYAFLDASWRISHGQSPCVVAFGSTQSDATNRRENERMLSWGAVTANWGAWRYYYASKRAGGGKRGTLDDRDLPALVAVHTVSARGNTDNEVQEVADSLGIRVGDDRMIQTRPFGLKAIRTADSQVVIEPDGDFELTVEREQRAKAAADLISEGELVTMARQIVDQFGFARDQEYREGIVRYLAQNSASDGVQEGEPEIVERTVVFDQVIGDLAFIDPDAGHLEITFSAADNEVVRIRSTMRAATPSYVKAAREVPSRRIEEVREIAMLQALESPVPDERGEAKNLATLEAVPESEEVGYMMIAGAATPVYRVLLYDPRYPQSKLQQVIVPLAVVE